MELSTVSAPLEIKFASNPDLGEFEGYGSFFGNVDAHGDIVQQGAFASSLAERKTAGRGFPGMHLNHGIPEAGGERGVGVWLHMAEDTRGLYVKGRLSGMNTDRGRYLFERVKDGAIGGLSIGYMVRPNGASYASAAAGAIRTLSAIDLFEVSLVDEPANPLTRVEGVKLAGVRDLESMLRRGGLSKAAARRVADAGWPALSRTTPESTPAAFDVEALDRALERHASELKGLLR
ncbi:hypothetical protein ASG52_25250 [Methylobacterium sp. Leaf456]|uniref:HK97 family phage prohead protease n=1 Tax=Methylobacterium sp. Leaf456 TaxID=1736382 RepID=UPI0006F580FC|nr:HK97 family phage prohead protease [Methylobacterium sp. Leaf456]KQT55034.1 hypothetical protein ASG52_25250 [Methylobacterium sp. Leaf456]